MQLIPRITQCVDCQSLRDLLKKVECSLLSLHKNRLNTEFYGVQSYFSLSESIELSHYRRILKRRIYGFNYLKDIQDQDIITQVIKRLFGECPVCIECEDFNTTTTSPGESTSTTTIQSTNLSTTLTTTTTTQFIELSPTLPTINCGDQGEFSGGQIFPSVQEVVLGSSLGTVTLDFNSFNIPDKYLVIFDGGIVIDTGYRGDSSYQTQLDNNLISRGLSSETIQGGGTGVTSFEKTTTTTSAFVYIYAPLPNTRWEYTLHCPV